MKSSQPTLARSQWEWKICVTVWTMAAVWTLTVSWLLGYQASERSKLEAIPSLILGMSAWVFWGIFCPWIAVTLITVGVGIRMQDDESATLDPDSLSRKTTGDAKHV